MSKQRCEGKRLQRRGSMFGVFKCTRKARILIQTQVGFTEPRYCCNDDGCYGSITGGYPVTVIKVRRD